MHEFFQIRDIVKPHAMSMYLDNWNKNVCFAISWVVCYVIDTNSIELHLAVNNGN